MRFVNKNKVGNGPVHVCLDVLPCKMPGKNLIDKVTLPPFNKIYIAHLNDDGEVIDDKYVFIDGPECKSIAETLAIILRKFTNGKPIPPIPIKLDPNVEIEQIDEGTLRITIGNRWIPISLADVSALADALSVICLPI